MADERPGPRLVTSKAACMQACREAARAGRDIALVPTMGSLHAGHAALLTAARAAAPTPPGDGKGRLLVCSIFVNPTQFGPGEDLAAYPRDLEADLAVCAERGVDLVFAPERPQEIYPPGFATTVHVDGLGAHLCGASRPGHFDGVATVVSLLFGIVRPDRAYFGEKDFQQLAVIRRLSQDLALGVEIIGVPTVREEDGLARSSRNAYLGPQARTRALSLWRAQIAAREAFAGGERRVGRLRASALEALRGGLGPDDAIDYLEFAAPELLEPLGPEEEAEETTRFFVAVLIAGSEASRPTRLIDNGALGG